MKTIPMNVEDALNKLTEEVRTVSSEVSELKAMVAQLGPANYKPPIETKIAALKSQGISLLDHLESQKKPRKPYGSSKRSTNSKKE